METQKQTEVKPRPAHWFKPGQSGNPGGKPNGQRNRLQGSFMQTLADDFDKHGRAAIVACREKSPEVYVRVVASLMPKELEIVRPLDELSDDELAATLEAVRAIRSAQAGAGGSAAGEGDGPAVAAEQVADVPALPEAGGVPRRRK